MVVGQPITDPIAGPSFDFSFTFGPELAKRPLRGSTMHMPEEDARHQNALQQL